MFGYSKQSITKEYIITRDKLIITLRYIIRNKKQWFCIFFVPRLLYFYIPNFFANTDRKSSNKVQLNSRAASDHPKDMVLK